MRGKRLGLLALAALVLTAWPARAADTETVNAAIERGVRYLKALQLENGTWAHDQIGMTALCAMTLLECGVPVDDPGILKAADAVRAAAVDTETTYSCALAILFLDRLGEPVDEALIESLTVRLLGGQCLGGDWSYTCPKIAVEEQRRLMTLVKEHKARGPDKENPRPKEPGQRKVEDLPREIRLQLEQVKRIRMPGPNLPGTMIAGDHSNTQFAVLGLWVARRHGLPVDAALLETDRHFRLVQTADGGWRYGGGKVMMDGHGLGMGLMPGMGPTPAMTCAGLLGIGLAYGAWNETALRTDTKEKEPRKPGAPGGQAKDPSKDQAVVNAMRLVGAWVDAMAHQPGGKVPQINIANGKFYYFLWSLERVAVAYGLDKFGKTDWYDWGSDILLANQGREGGWDNGEFRVADTCFALLFLKRANLAQDLSRALKTGMKDGMQAALKSGGFGGAGLLKGRKPFFDSSSAEEKPDADADAQAKKLGKQLVAAEGDRQEQALKELRDSKGAAYTEALAVAIPQLEGDALKKARAALAERMSRMNAATLGIKLVDDDPEVRRAAALAVAMKEEKVYAEKLADMLNDPEPTVARAAHAALKSLSGDKDFGPPKDASAQERGKAILAWKVWWRKQLEEKR